MAKCNECGSEYLEGTLYCIECGSSILSDSEDVVSGDIESTVKIPNVAAIAEIATDAEELTQPLGRLHGIGVHAKRAIFVIESSGREVALDLNGEIKIGRKDPHKELFPDLDLTDDQGFESGVSRMHAKVQASELGVVIVDLGSTNGTQLNNRNLPQQEPYPLKNGDYIRVGGLLIQVYFET